MNWRKVLFIVLFAEAVMIYMIVLGALQTRTNVPLTADRRVPPIAERTMPAGGAPAESQPRPPGSAKEAGGRAASVAFGS